MGRRATEPWHWRNAWYTVREGQRVKLTSGAADDRYARARAWVAFWECHSTPLVDRLRAVNWTSLALAQMVKENPAWVKWADSPEGEDGSWGDAEYIRHLTGGGRLTEEQVAREMEKMGVTLDMLSLFVRQAPE